MNRGNFLELMHLLARFDSILATHLEKGRRNAIYMSHDILMDVTASILLDQITVKVKEAFFLDLC